MKDNSRPSPAPEAPAKWALNYEHVQHALLESTKGFLSHALKPAHALCGSPQGAEQVMGCFSGVLAGLLSQIPDEVFIPAMAKVQQGKTPDLAMAMHILRGIGQKMDSTQNPKN